MSIGDHFHNWRPLESRLLPLTHVSGFFAHTRRLQIH